MWTIYYKRKNKRYIKKPKLKLKYYKNCLEVDQFENALNKLEKYNIKVDSLKENHKEFRKDNRLILKSKTNI